VEIVVPGGPSPHDHTLCHVFPLQSSSLPQFKNTKEHSGVDGRKKTQKVYYSHTGKPGELRQQPFAILHQKFPHRIFELSIKRMLPSGFIKRHIHRRLKVYAGGEHPHISQNPINIDV
jgi:ribosomal protein L13